MIYAQNNRLPFPLQGGGFQDGYVEHVKIDLQHIDVTTLGSIHRQYIVEKTAHVVFTPAF